MEPAMKWFEWPASIVLYACFGLSGCGGRDEHGPSYAPGLGEIMTFTQMR
jgi:hypothetical protein